MHKNQLGIGSFAYRYHIGIPAYHPPVPMKPLDFIVESSRLGLKRVQLCENLKYADYDASYIRTLAETAQKLGLIVEIGMNGASLENLRKHIDLARIVKSKFIRVVIGDAASGNRNTIDTIADNLKTVLDECGESGIEIGIENHFDLATPQIMRIIQKVDNDLVGSVLDTTNCVYFLERPEEALGFMLHHIKSVHLKDFCMVKTEAGITLAGQILGQGILEAKSIVKAVTSRNPDASIIIELSIRRKDGMSASGVLAAEKNQIEQSVEYAKTLIGLRP
jgi:sugar phosphate isomerase/epimerase